MGPKFQFGAHVKDVITGLSGYVTGRVEYMTGCTQYIVQPTLKADGAYQEGRWTDQERLVLSGDASIELPSHDSDGPDIAAPMK